MATKNREKCPICKTQELTSATKVYPLCECKLHLCFDCLKRYAKMRYCCPFCSVPFSQNTFRQTAEELRFRLQGEVASDILEDVVKVWVNWLKEMRSEMDVGLAVLSLDTDGYFSSGGRSLSRSSLRSLQRYLSYSSHLFHVMPTLSNMNVNNTISSVQPVLAQKSNNIRGSSALGAEMSSLQRTWSAPSAPLNDTSQLPQDVDNLSPDRTYSWHMKRFLISDADSFGPAHITEEEDFNDESVPSRTSGEEKNPNSRFSDCQQEPVWNFPSGVDALGFNKCVKNGGSGLSSILEKRLYVRELVNILPGTDLSRKLPSDSVGVVMKYTGKLPARLNGSLRLGNHHPVSLTIRLLDGSWLTKVAVKDVEAKGERATLRQYLRVGDLLLTRFGIALTCELHPTLGQVTVRFPKGLENFEKLYNISNLDEIYQGVRTVCGFAAAANPNDILNYQEVQSRNIKSGKHNISTYKQEDDSKGSELENNLLREINSAKPTMTKKNNASVLKRNAVQGYREEKFPNRSITNPSPEMTNRFNRSLGEFNELETKEFLSIDDNLSSTSGYELPKYTDGSQSSWPMFDQNVGRFTDTNDAEMRKIYEGDLQAVFSAREVFDVIEKKIAEDHRHQIAMTLGNKRKASFRQIVPSKDNPMSKRQCELETLDEKVMSQEPIHHLLPMASPPKGSQRRIGGSYDDLMISYSSNLFMSPGNSRSLIDFRNVEDS